jgi:hypothetical protein
VRICSGGQLLCVHCLPLAVTVGEDVGEQNLLPDWPGLDNNAVHNAYIPVDPHVYVFEVSFPSL